MPCKSYIHFLLIMMLSCPVLGWAKDKYALVIGNGAYKSGRLKNPANDALLMGETLKKLGFKLIGGKAHTNLNKEKMSEQIIELGDKLRSSKGVGLFYFAGHGVQFQGSKGDSRNHGGGLATTLPRR